MIDFTKYFSEIYNIIDNMFSFDQDLQEDKMTVITVNTLNTLYYKLFVKTTLTTLFAFAVGISLKNRLMYSYTRNKKQSEDKSTGTSSTNGGTFTGCHNSSAIRKNIYIGKNADIKTNNDIVLQTIYDLDGESSEDSDSSDDSDYVN